MNAKFLTVCCVGLITWIGLGQAAQAQDCPPPFGTWMGKDGNLDVVLTISPNGDAQYGAGPYGVAGRWTWSPSSTGGIITIHYVQPGIPRNIGRLYYSLTPIGPNQLVLSDPFIRLVMNRR